MSRWKRVRRELLRVVLVLVALELIVRIGPIQAFLAPRLDPYENLLWYDVRMPMYQNQLHDDPNYTIWMLGSSPMMTAWNPEQIQNMLRQNGYADITVQNYGFTILTNLHVMAQLVDDWLLELDQPQYLVLGISQINFSQGASQRMRIEDSQLENILIYPDNIDDYANRFLYTHSVLYRNLILVRHALSISIEETSREPRRRGGYTERAGRLECVTSEEADTLRGERGAIAAHLQNDYSGLDEIIDLARARALPILVVSLPPARCQLEQYFGSVEVYQQRYLEPLVDHLQQRGITLVELDTLFYDQIPPDEQDSYFDDGTHTNKWGAELISEWLTQAIDEWLKNNP